MVEPRDANVLEETLPLPAAGAPAHEAVRSYLLVFSGGTSTLFPLVANSEVVIGRAEECSLRLLDSSVSRVHAKLINAGAETRLLDMGSHNGSRVNGERVSGTMALGSGDVVSIGQVTLVFHRDARLPTRRPLLDAPQLRLRLEEEIERSLRYHRPVTVLWAELGTQPVDRNRIAAMATAQLRVIDVAAWLGESQLVIVLPETVGEAAGMPGRRLLRALESVAPEARAGFATCAEDGVDVDTLLGSARSAAQRAALGQIAPASEAATSFEVGDRKIVVADAAMLRLFALIERLSVSDLPVLVWGETGTGKEIAAAAIHHWSRRKQHPLVAINCAALQETLIESELFGHERGAFSGADSPKAGIIESAHGGTLFLDEIGELGAAAQAKLLRVVETKRVSRLGSVADREVDVRVVAATNRSLEEEVKAGRFRSDLYFRLSAASVFIPPLRDRAADIPILARAFLAAACTRLQRSPLALGPATMQALATHPWPGNVRELRNAMDYVAATAGEGPTVEAWMLPFKGAGAVEEGARIDRLPTSPTEGAPQLPPTPESFRSIYDEIRELERRRIAEALAAADGVQVRAAELIGMPLRTFVTKMKQYQLQTGRGRVRPDQG